MPQFITSIKRNIIWSPSYKLGKNSIAQTNSSWNSESGKVVPNEREPICLRLFTNHLPASFSSSSFFVFSCCFCLVLVIGCWLLDCSLWYAFCVLCAALTASTGHMQTILKNVWFSLEANRRARALHPASPAVRIQSLRIKLIVPIQYTNHDRSRYRLMSLVYLTTMQQNRIRHKNKNIEASI